MEIEVATSNRAFTVFSSDAYLRRYDNAKNSQVSLMYPKYPKHNPAIACKNAPKMYKNFGPIFAPRRVNIGANKKAAKFAIPKTKPYSLDVAPFFSASFG